MEKSNSLERACALLHAHKNFKTLFELTCAHNSLAAALYLEGGQEKSISFAQYRQMADDYAAYLQAYFPKSGRIAISLDTCKEWFPVFWGVIRSGHDALLLDASLNDEGVAYLMAQAGCRAIITQKPRSLAPETRQLSAGQLFAAPRAQGFQPTYGGSVALCTSGTTGMSRIFVYSQEAIAEQVLSSQLLYRQNQRLVADENRRSLVFLPFHHVFGFIANLLWCGFLGYGNIYLADRAPRTIMETAQRFKPQLLITVPLLANNLCASLHKQLQREKPARRAAFRAARGVSLFTQRLSPAFGLWLAEKVLFKGTLERVMGTELKCVILGGSHTPTEHLRTLNALGYYTVCGFGMTETAITSVETAMSLDQRLSGSVGRPLENVEYCVEGGGSTGELMIRGKSIHTGCLREGMLLPPDTREGGWYPTGDVVRLAEGGRMFIEGRSKDVIVNESGENVYPDELEDLFAGQEGVEQLSILGVAREGRDRCYEDITLVMNVGQRWQDGEYLAALGAQVAGLNQKLPPIKRLTRALATGEQLPLTNGIKVKRLKLKEMIADGSLACRELDLKAQGAPSAMPQTAAQPREDNGEIREKVRALFAQGLDLPLGSFADDAHLMDDLGGDSLQVLSIALKAEEQFGLLIPTEDYGKCATVNDMSALIASRLAGETADAKQTYNQEVQPITRFEDSLEYKAFQERQRGLMAAGKDNPYFVCHDSPLRDKSLMAGQEVLNFGSYNYVGMSGRPEVQEAAKAAIDQYGTSASGSRLLAGEKRLYQELEREIADWKHTESALVCVGGHSTNVTFVGNFCGERDLIVYDALAHNSVEQGCQLSKAVSKPFPHNDPAALESILRTQRRHFEKVLIVIEGAYSMDGDIADVPAFVRLKKEYGCFLMVDEAHSACVIGQTGGGVDEYFGLAPTDVDIKMGTLSKGLGTCGGYLAGSRSIIDYLRYSLPGFVFSVGISPALAAGTLEALRQLRQNPQIMADMRRNIQCFADSAKKRGLDICLAGETAILPVLVGRDEDAFALSNAMRREGVFVPPAVYPAVPKNKARLRFCVISEHQPEQIERALDVLEKAARELEIALPRRAYA